MPLRDQEARAAPLGRGGWKAILIGVAIDEVTFCVEMVVDIGMDGSAFL